MGSEKLVLLVEDNPNDEAVVLRALQESYIRTKVVVARDGEEAMMYLTGEKLLVPKDPTAIPDMVLLDLKLPKISGLEILSRVRKIARLATVPIVALSSSDVDADILTCYELGANSFIQKPIDFDEFINRIKLLAIYWLEANRAGILSAGRIRKPTEHP